MVAGCFVVFFKEEEKVFDAHFVEVWEGVLF